MHRLLCLGLLLAAAPAAAADDPEAPPPRSLPPSMTAPAAPPPATSPEAAEPEHGYVGIGLSLTGDVYLNFALVFEGGVKLPDLPLWVRGTGGFGEVSDADGDGTLGRGAIGLGTRTCITPGVCGFLELEVGYQTQHWEPTSYRAESGPAHHFGAILTGRGGIDLGGEHVRFRVGLESSRYHDNHGDESTSGPAWIGGAGLSLAIVIRV